MKEITLTFKQDFNLETLADGNEMRLMREASETFNGMIVDADELLGADFDIEEAEADGLEKMKETIATYILEKMETFVNNGKKDLKDFVHRLENNEDYDN